MDVIDQAIPIIMFLRVYNTKQLDIMVKRCRNLSKTRPYNGGSVTFKCPTLTLLNNRDALNNDWHKSNKIVNREKYDKFKGWPLHLHHRGTGGFHINWEKKKTAKKRYIYNIHTSVCRRSNSLTFTLHQ